MLWDSRMESGISVIDHEHQEMIRHIAGLLDEPDPERIKETLVFLRQYVVKHFAHEQLMHKGCAYPHAAEHKRVHMEFVETFLKLEAEYLEKGYCPETLGNIVNALNAWLKEHILGMDMEFALFYKSLAPDERPSETSYHARPTECFLR